MEPGADMFFQDEPNAKFFAAELTLCGRKGESWYPISTFSWGYTPQKGRIINYFYKSVNPSEYHLNWVYKILTNFNINFNLNW